MLYLSEIDWKDYHYRLLSSDKGVVYFGIEPMEWILSNYKDNIVSGASADEHNRKYIEDMKDYLQGRLTAFDWEYDLRGTEFQQDVWNELLKIPFGKTTTYGAIAGNINRPKAVRAVGGAVGKNPVTIAVPCHRVIGKNGKLTGFSSGLDMKRMLLDIEQIPYTD